MKWTYMFLDSMETVVCGLKRDCMLYRQCFSIVLANLHLHHDLFNLVGAQQAALRK